MVLGLPVLNFISVITSFLSGSFICFILYNIHPHIFFNAVFHDNLLIDVVKSSIKTCIFAFFISITSCVWGITNIGGSRSIGTSTTSSVVTCLLIVFILNFILSYLFFDNSLSSFQFL
uniref:Uncharacterized protein n=1 Tax=Osmundea sinicola TaxID=290685 RepID=A0A7L4WP97_9FLOR|nr:hypothetical protein [Osmundea sinicola]QFR99826.1 hypothetical protein [Osmundea sinicola]